MIRALAILFVALEAVAAFWLGAVARHGPAGLGAAALAYLAVAIAATAWAARRTKSVVRLAGLGILLLGLAPALLLSLDHVESARRERRIAATRVSAVRDEPIVSRGGRDIGIRFSFVAEVPTAGDYYLLPHLRPIEAAADRVALSAVRWSVDGRQGPSRLDAGPHVLVFELYPAILYATPDGELCLAPIEPPPLAAQEPPARLRVDIWETRFGTERDERTHGAYSLPGLYRNVLAEGIPRCS